MIVIGAPHFQFDDVPTTRNFPHACKYFNPDVFNLCALKHSIRLNQFGWAALVTRMSLVCCQRKSDVPNTFNSGNVCFPFSYSSVHTSSHD